jgi:CMP-N-acetylneuraminic acid synthetase
MIVAIIPIRKGSVRVRNKNLKPFFNTSLLENKITQLKTLDGVDIVVDTDSDVAIEIATKHGINYRVRDPYFASSECSGSEFYEHISLNTDPKYKYIMYMPATSPMVNVLTIKNIISDFINQDEYDSFNTISDMKHHMWINTNGKYESLNYDQSNAPNSQDLPDIVALNYAINIISRDLMIKRRNIVGSNPKFIKIDQIEALDIDTPADFRIAELIYRDHVTDQKIKPIVLDCTVRDGGYVNDWDFSNEFVIDCYKSVSACKIDYFEVGFMENGHGKWHQVRDVRWLKDTVDGCKIAAMTVYTDQKTFDFNDSQTTGIDLIRTIFNFCTSNTCNFKQYCLDIINKGYELSINIAYAHLLTENEIKLMAEIVRGVPVKYIYIADTFGTCSRKQIEFLIQKINQYVLCDIGFHAHDNSGHALNNTISALQLGAAIVDCTILGIGRGAGNLSAERLLMYLGNDPRPIMEFGSKYIRDHNSTYSDPRYKFGLSSLYLLGSKYEIHPNYIVQLLEKGLDMSDCYRIIDTIGRSESKNKYDKLLVTELIRETQE